MEKCYTLENGLYCIFQAIGNILNLKQKQQNINVKVKETDLLWSQICSSLLQFPTVNVHSTILWRKG